MASPLTDRPWTRPWGSRRDRIARREGIPGRRSPRSQSKTSFVEMDQPGRCRARHRPRRGFPVATAFRRMASSGSRAQPSTSVQAAAWTTTSGRSRSEPDEPTPSGASRSNAAPGPRRSARAGPVNGASARAVATSATAEATGRPGDRDAHQGVGPQPLTVLAFVVGVPVARSGRRATTARCRRTSRSSAPGRPRRWSARANRARRAWNRAWMDGSSSPRWLARADDLRGGPRADDRLVRRQRAVVARRPDRNWDAYYERQYGQRLRTTADARRGHGLDRAARVGPGHRPRRHAVHRAARAGYWTRASRSRRARRGGCRARPRPTRGRRAHRGLDRRRRVRPRPRARPASDRRGGRGPRHSVCGTGDRASLITLDRRGVGRGPQGRIGYAPTDPTAPPNAYGRSKLAGEQAATHRLRTSTQVPESWGSRGPRGCSARRGATSRTRSSMLPRRPRPTLSRCGSWATMGHADVRRRCRRRDRRAARRGRPRWHPPPGQWRIAPVPTGPDDVLARLGVRAPVEPVPATTWVRASEPPRWGVLGRDATPGRRTDAAPGGGDGRYAPILRRNRATLRPDRRADDVSELARPSSTLEGVRYGGDRPIRGRPRLVPRAVARGPFGPIDPPRPAGPGLRPRFVQPTCPPLRRVSCAACISTGASSTTGSWPRARLRGPRRRPADACVAQAARSSRPASSWPTTGSIIPIGVAHGFLALEPLELIYLVTNEYDGTDELGSPGTTRSPAVPWPRSSRRRTVVRSSPTATARTRPSPSWWSACAPTADATPMRADRTGPTRRTGRPTARPEGATAPGTIPRLSRAPVSARLGNSDPAPIPESSLAPHPRRPAPRPRRPPSAFAVPAPARAAQTSDAKVVIIVGATHGSTSRYRAYADRPTLRRSSTPRTS